MSTGSVLKLACRSRDPHGTLTWFKNGKKVEGQGSRIYTLNDVQISDNGIYTCRVNTEAAGPSQHSNTVRGTVLGEICVRRGDKAFKQFDG